MPSMTAVSQRWRRPATSGSFFVTGRGRAFSAGGDLKSYRRPAARFGALPASSSRSCTTRSAGCVELRTPVVALVNGVTAAGGAGAAAELRPRASAAASARIADGHLNFGQMGGGGVLTLLARMVGTPARDRADPDRQVPVGRRGCRLGSWSRRFVPDDQLHSEAGLELAGRIAVKSPLAVANAKSVLTHDLGRGDDRFERARVRAGAQYATYCLTSRGRSRKGCLRSARSETPEFHRPVTQAMTAPVPDADSAPVLGGAACPPHPTAKRCDGLR